VNTIIKKKTRVSKLKEVTIIITLIGKKMDSDFDSCEKSPIPIVA